MNTPFPDETTFNLITPELTNICNYSCPRCPHSQMTRPQGYMDFDLFVKIFEECKSIVRELNFSFFGEPMLHPKFLNILEFIKSNKVKPYLTLNTNLSCATQDMLHSIINVPFSQIRFSIDAATPETYFLVRPAEYTVDLEGRRHQGNRLDLIEQKLEWWHSQDNHIPTRHVYTVSSINRCDLPIYAAKWLPKLGSKDDLLAKRLLTYGGKISDPLVKPHPCNIWNLRIAAIDWQGNVSPCNLDTDMELKIGNISEKSLIQIFNSKEWEENRVLSVNKKRLPCCTCVDSNAWSEDRSVLVMAGEELNDTLLSRFT